MSLTENKLPNETLENAIGVYKTTIDVCQNVDDEDYNPNFDKVTVAFLEELQQYRAIGTVDELKDLKEKNERIIEILRTHSYTDEMCVEEIAKIVGIHIEA